jgi:hypothetical protein
MIPPDTQLDPELIWQDDGCLSDEAIAALVDGELAIVPGAAAHAETCESCSAKVGSAALLALEIATAIDAWPSPAFVGAPALAPALRRRPFPLLALSLAIAVAFAALIPNLATFFAHLGSLPMSPARLLTFTAQVISRSSTGVSWLAEHYHLDGISAVLLTLIGAMIARLAPRHLNQQGAT